MSVSLPVDYYDGRTSRRQMATMEMRGSQLVLRASSGERCFAAADVEVSEPLGRAPRVLRLPGGAFCEVRDRDGFEDWARRAGFHAGYRTSAVMGLQSRWPWAVGALVAVVAVIVASYLWVLPAVAARVAPAVPPAFAAFISETALRSLDGQLLQPSRLSAERQAAISARVAALAMAASGVPSYRLNFRSAPRIGANAFALPDGQIVILDELVKLARDDDDVAAVVAHELGHVANYHGMRQLMQSAVVSFVVGTYLGDVSSLAASLAALVVESSYSREFELEADRYGGRMLLAGGSSPMRLADMLLRLETSHRGRVEKGSGTKDGDDMPPPPPESSGRGGAGTSTPEDPSLTDYLSSHPATRARIEALRALH